MASSVFTEKLKSKCLNSETYFKVAFYKNIHHDLLSLLYSSGLSWNIVSLIVLYHKNVFFHSHFFSMPDKCTHPTSGARVVNVCTIRSSQRKVPLEKFVPKILRT